MKIAFYRSRRGGWIDWAINACSGRGGFSHVELVFSDGTFFSSSGMDGGVRFKKIKPKPEAWACYHLPIPPHHEHTIRCWCREQLGKKYDWLGVLGFICPTRHQQGRWFCSEICIAALQAGGLLRGVAPWKVQPNALELIVRVAIHLQPKHGSFDPS